MTASVCTKQYPRTLLDGEMCSRARHQAKKVVGKGPLSSAPSAAGSSYAEATGGKGKQSLSPKITKMVAMLCKLESHPGFDKLLSEIIKLVNAFTIKIIGGQVITTDTKTKVTLKNVPIASRQES